MNEKVSLNPYLTCISSFSKFNKEMSPARFFRVNRLSPKSATNRTCHAKSTVFFSYNFFSSKTYAAIVIRNNKIKIKRKGKPYCR